MSHPLIEHSPDLQRLKDDGYVISIKDSHIVVEHIPFVTDQGGIVYGALVSELTAQGDTTLRPNGHVVGTTHTPRDHQGNILTYLVMSHTQNTAGEHITVCQLSNTPAGKEPDNYYEKITHYIEMIVPHAQSIDASVTAKVNDPQDSSTDDVFHYTDSNTSRAGTGKYAAKLAHQKIAIVGLGGTGLYILDLVAKTPVREIHLYDDDTFSNHNAFRSPGAASKADLDESMSKVAYATRQYSKMHRYIYPHEARITEENINELAENDFIFLCIDNAASRGTIARILAEKGKAFIDVGISIEAGQLGLTGAARTTIVSPEHPEALASLPLETTVDDLYSSNIQMADANMLNAAYAIIVWKQWSGFYFNAHNKHEIVSYLDTGMNTLT